MQSILSSEERVVEFGQQLTALSHAVSSASLRSEGFEQVSLLDLAVFDRQVMSGIVQLIGTLCGWELEASLTGDFPNGVYYMNGSRLSKPFFLNFARVRGMYIFSDRQSFWSFVEAARSGRKETSLREKAQDSIEIVQKSLKCLGLMPHWPYRISVNKEPFCLGMA